MDETADYDKSATPKAHAPTHESGGSDEIDITGLDPSAHAPTHESGGSDEIDVSGLDPKAHALTHKLGGSDEIDVSGLVHTSVCRAQLSADQNINTMTYTKVAFDVADVDRNGDFDTVNHKFVVPANGVYLLLGQLQWKVMVANKRLIARILKNGSIIGLRNAQTAYAEFTGHGVFTIHYLEAGDDITLVAYHNTGAVEQLVWGPQNTLLLIVRLY